MDESRTMADLSVSKRSDKTTAKRGDVITYTIAVTNYGPGNASGVLLKDTLPSELSNAVYSEDMGNNWRQWGGSLDLGDMRLGSVIVIIRAKLRDSRSSYILNTATADSKTPDPYSQNNSDSTKIRII